MKPILYIFFCFSIIACHAQSDTSDNQQGSKDSTMNENPFNALTPEESRVILNKGTEPAYTGEYTDNKARGTYICRQCNAPLYRSADKFDSRCGWPSFDDEIDGAITRKPDADGRRTEIICTNCKGHLGHVFEGEGFTDKDVRHCVNSISMQFVPASDSLPEVLSAKAEIKLDTATLGAGCFWCVDAIFRELKGVHKVEVGYSGGKINAPTYKMVCAGGTGHVEVARIWFDPSVISYEQLLDIFFHTHDPTSLNRQGNDVGDQYRSVIFYHNEAQKIMAEKVLAATDSSGLWDDKIVTAIEPLKNYFQAEDYHQNYFNQNKEQGYCSVVIAPKVQKFRKKYKDLLKED
jgi:peptide methionine sulfoxide reductase msrA/msrB